MSPISSAQSGPSSSASDEGTSKKGKSKLGEPMKRKSISVKNKDPTPGTSSSSSGTTKGKQGPLTPKKKVQGKGSNSNNGSSGGDEPKGEPTLDPVNEELDEATYVDDYIDAVDLVDDIARQNSRMLEAHCDQLSCLQEIEDAMSKLLGENDSDDLEPGNLSDKKKGTLRMLEGLLINASRAGDKGVRASDEIESIVADKLHVLEIDYKNLSSSRARIHGNSESQTSSKSGNVKKPSINPGPRSRGTPSKLCLPPKGDNGGLSKLSYPIALSTPGSSSPAPSFASSTSSFDNLKGSQTPIDPVFMDDSRYRACKFKNPAYVFSSRVPPGPGTAAAETPQKTGKNSQKKTDDQGGKGKSKGKSSKTSTSKISSSQGSKSSKQGQSGAGGNESSEESEEEYFSDSGDSTPEPTYCVCEKISHGKMVQCDNELCPIEWFHFRCVNLKKIPKGDWFCPRCRGGNSSVMKPKSEFLKELEEYNKQKERETM